MSRAPELVLRRAVMAAKCALVAVLAFFAVSSAVARQPTTEGVTAAQEISAPSAGQARLDKLIARHDCSATGFGADVIPGSSLVLRRRQGAPRQLRRRLGRLHRRAPGTLLALCRVTV